MLVHWQMLKQSPISIFGCVTEFSEFFHKGVQRGVKKKLYQCLFDMWVHTL